jgi:chitodextrinase
VNHLVFGLTPAGVFDVRRDGQPIARGVQPSPIGSLAFSADGGGSFEILTAGSFNPPPAQVTDLATGSPTRTSITLTWTAVGADGDLGRASTYDIRYSTSPITVSNWGAATQVQGENPPGSAGQAESFPVNALAAGTIYYFALKVADEVPSWSGISNTVSATTLPPPDTAPPSAVSNLSSSSPSIDTIRLTWSAVGDDGSTGRATIYDIRYSTSTITPANWDGAAQIGNEPTPAASGQSETCTVSGLSPGTTYYFAMKVADEVPNWSALSNVPHVATLPQPDAIPPAAVASLAAGSPTSNSLTVTWIAVGDDGSSGQASVYDLRYAASTITPANWGSAVQVGGEPAPRQPGQSESFTVTQLQSDERYFFALRVRDEAMNWSEISNIASAKTLPALDTTPPGSITDLRAGGTGYHSIDLIWTAPSDDSLSERATSYEGRYTTGSLTASTWSSATPIEALPVPAAPGQTERFTLPGLAPATSYTIGVRARDETGHLAAIGAVLQAATTSASDTLPPDRVADLAVVAGTTLSITLRWHAPVDRVPRDCIDSPDVDRYEIRIATSPLAGAGWDSGTLIAGPHPEPSGTPQDWVIGGLEPSTHYFIALRSCDPRDNCSEISNQVEHSTADPEPLPDGIPPGDVGDLAAAAQGTESILLSWRAPGGDGSDGKADHYDIRRSTQPLTLGTWDGATLVSTDKPCLPAGAVESYLADRLDPSTVYYFALRAIDAAGNQGPISPSVSDTTDALPAPTDQSPPAAVLDLLIAAADTTSVSLEWTAPSDDRGHCASYELRRSAVEVDSSNWESATLIVDAPLPGEPGTPGSHRVANLSPATRYFFALRAFDDAGNRSPLSNVVSVETDAIPAPPDTTAPATVTDIAATPLGSTEILLTWTAVGDDGLLGAAASYEVRRAFQPIESANWDQATEVAVSFAPGEPHATESLTVGDLLPATTYHFAVRVRDEAGNLSACSPDASVATAPIPDTSPPAAPAGLGMETGEDRVHLTWYPSPEPDVVDYTLFRRAAEGSGIGPLRVTGLRSPAFEDTTARPEIDYYYSVTARDGSGNLSSPGGEIHVRLELEGFLPLVTGYSAQSIATAIDSGQRSRVRLAWLATTGDRFAEFGVDRSTDNGATWDRRATGGFASKNGYEFEEEVARGAYLYRIAAISPLGYELLFPSITVNESGGATRNLIDGPFPNPSSGPLQFTITLVSDARIRILAYDLQGRSCGTLRDDVASAGTHSWSFDSQAAREGPLVSGVYFLRIMVDEEQIVRKFIVEK